jgi:hypothetical protein
MKVEKINVLPGSSILNHDHGIFDFVETYYIAIKTSDIGLDKLIFSFFSSIPGWLMRMLNFRIKTETVDGSKLDYSEGDIIGPFHLFHKVNNEVVLGINAKNIDYRISLFIERNNNSGLIFITALTINNYLGTCQLTFVKTIYRLIIPRILQTLTSYL